MNNQKIDLALAFLKLHPVSAAAVLEQQPADDVAAFLGDVPFTHAATVLKRMLPQYIASVCKNLKPAVAASFYSEMEFNLVAAVMRRSDEDLNREVLKLLPERTKMACRLLLHYTEEVVGAWMTANIMTLPNDCTAQEASALLASEQDSIDADTVHIVDRERKLQGVVGVTSLLRAAPDTPIMSIMKKNPYAISGRATLVSAANHPAWAHTDTIVVVNRNQQIVGIIRHVDLRKGLNEVSNTIARTSGSDSLTGILEVYGNSLLVLFSTVCEAANTRASQGGYR